MKLPKRMDRLAWLQLGLRQLADEGPESLKLEALCSAAQRTTGSFYHHFPDHDSFLTALADHWLATGTVDIWNQVKTQAPERRSMLLSELASRLDHRLERAMRHFSMANAYTASIVAKVDRLRVDAISSLYIESGVGEELALEIARIEYAAFVGSQVIWPEMQSEARQKLDRRFASIVAKAMSVKEDSRE